MKLEAKKNIAQILVLDRNISEQEAVDMLWRRETHQVGSGKKYERPDILRKNTILVERLVNFHSVAVVLYTKIDSNIKSLTPRKLAFIAIKSAKSELVFEGCDGVSYLIDAKNRGILTPLMPAYENEILREVGARNLQEALSILKLQWSNQTPDVKFKKLTIHLKNMTNKKTNEFEN